VVGGAAVTGGGVQTAAPLLRMSSRLMRFKPRVAASPPQAIDASKRKPSAKPGQKSDLRLRPGGALPDIGGVDCSADSSVGCHCVRVGSSGE
jgi:hypothetical protein